MEENYEDIEISGEEAGEKPNGGPINDPRRLDADAILDTLVPGSIDWRDTVRRHPFGSVACVGLVGYLVGRTKGAAIMAGITAGLSSAMMRQLSDVFEGDFFEF
jgi:hypothetical protein